MAEMDVTTASAVGLMLLAASEVPNFLAGALPSFLTIRRFGADDEDVRSLRVGETAGGAMALAVGAGASLVARSWLPFLATVVTLAAMLSMYEWAIRNPHPQVASISGPENLARNLGGYQ
ncbi:MAG TPA: hypothetical protein VFC99_05690 [Acidimicrobiia bacterium]|nr:hypothetical protein [Acidimicrobiia bacterium]